MNLQKMQELETLNTQYESVYKQWKDSLVNAKTNLLNKSKAEFATFFRDKGLLFRSMQMS